MRKICILLLFTIITNTIVFSQSTNKTNNLETLETVNSPYAQKDQVDFIDKLNASSPVHIIAYFLLAVFVLFLIYKIIKSLTAGKVQDIKIGPFSMKMNNKSDINHADNLSGTASNINIDQLLNLFQIVLSSSLELVFNEVTRAMNEIHKLEEEYKEKINNIFDNFYFNIESDFQQKMTDVIIRITKFEKSRISTTKEYFIMKDIMVNYRISWIENVHNIIMRNGFSDFIADRNKVNNYIDELINVISRCIDMTKLEATNMSKTDIDNIIKEIYQERHHELENMFHDLADLKIKTTDKKNKKLQYINDHIKETGNNIIKKFRESVVETVSNNINTNKNTEKSDK